MMDGRERLGVGEELSLTVAGLGGSSRLGGSCKGCWEKSPWLADGEAEPGGEVARRRGLVSDAAASVL